MEFRQRLMLTKNAHMKPYKPDTFQKIIEQPFRVKAEAHFVLNDIAFKLAKGEELPEHESFLLRDLFIEIQIPENQDIANDMITLRDLGRINTHEMYLIADYFMTSEQIGPDSLIMREAFLAKILTPEEFLEVLTKVSIPEHTKEVIKIAYEKIVS